MTITITTAIGHVIKIRECGEWNSGTLVGICPECGTRSRPYLASPEGIDQAVAEIKLSECSL